MEQKHYDLAVRLRHELHQHPELSLEETWTRRHLMDFLKAHTRLEVVDKGRWFYAHYRSGSSMEHSSPPAPISSPCWKIR